MPKITYIEFNGVAHTVDVKVGSTVMLGARDNNLPGIDADCGGGCSCGTCHVYVDPTWLERLNKKTELEAATMEFSNSVMPNSRLACQIPVTDELDGLVVRMPESQR